MTRESDAARSSGSSRDIGEYVGEANPLVAVLMGSRSDLRIMRGASDFLREVGVPAETKIVSAHRTPHVMFEYAASAKERGIKVIIAGAGGSAHLPGMIASLTTLPVIGVPIETRLGYANAVGSMIEMPKDICLFLVGPGQAAQAGLGAARILALTDERLALRLDQRFAKVGDEVRAQNSELQTRGIDGFLQSQADQ